MIGHEAKQAGNLASQKMQIMAINWVTYKGKRTTYKTYMEQRTQIRNNGHFQEAFKKNYDFMRSKK